MTDDEMIAWIIDRYEGHTFTNRPHDKGGPTKYGVTLDTLSTVRGKRCTAEDVAALTLDEARDVLLEHFVFRPNFHQIADWRLRLAVVDFGIHSGPARAAKALQAAVGVTADGIIGRESLWAIARADAVKAREKVIAARLRLMGHLLEQDPTQREHAEGWLSRVGSVLEAA